MKKTLFGALVLTAIGMIGPGPARAQQVDD